jgi:hypothetical protein
MKPNSCMVQPAVTPVPRLGWYHHIHSISIYNSTHNFISNLYVNIDFKLLFKTSHLYL